MHNVTNSSPSRIREGVMTTKSENRSPFMLHQYIIRPLLGAIGFYLLALFNLINLWDANLINLWGWLGDNSRELAAVAAVLNILWGGWRTIVWQYRRQKRKELDDSHDDEN